MTGGVFNRGITVAAARGDTNNKQILKSVKAERDDTSTTMLIMC